MSFGAGLEGGRLQVLWEDGERALCRGRRADEKRTPRNILAVRLTAEPKQHSFWSTRRTEKREAVAGMQRVIAIFATTVVALKL